MTDFISSSSFRYVNICTLYTIHLFIYIGITYFKTIGVVKNIIPAVASTNAIISASCVLECIKLLTYCNQTMNTYYMYIGNISIYTPTFEYIKKETCLVCNIQSNTIHTITLPYNTTLQEFIDILQTNNNYQLKKPSLTTNNKSLYIQNPVNLEAILRPNLNLKLCTLLGVSDPSMTSAITTTGTTYAATNTTTIANNNNNNTNNAGTNGGVSNGNGAGNSSEGGGEEDSGESNIITVTDPMLFDISLSFQINFV